MEKSRHRAPVASRRASKFYASVTTVTRFWSATCFSRSRVDEGSLIGSEAGGLGGAALERNNGTNGTIEMSNGTRGSGEGSGLVPNDAAERLRRAIEARALGRGSQPELEDAARVLVTTLKDEQRPPEQVLLLIKRILADAGLRPSYGDSSQGSPTAGSDAAIYRDIIALSIRYYYDGRGN